MTTVYLRKRTGNLWSIVNAASKIITGPHRWGNKEEAMQQAQNFCSTWKWLVLMEEDVEQPSSKDTVPSADGES